jgi:chromate transporter
MKNEGSASKKSGFTALKSRAVFLLNIFITFLKIGAITWGGGFIMISMIKKTCVEKRKWLTEDAFLDGISVCQCVPGSLTVNMATFVGYETMGMSGALCAVFGAILPSYITLIIIADFFPAFSQITMVQNFFMAAVPAIVGLLSSVSVDIGRAVFNLKYAMDIVYFTIFLIMLIVFNIHPIFVILIAGAIGLLRKAR